MRWVAVDVGGDAGGGGVGVGVGVAAVVAVVVVVVDHRAAYRYSRRTGQSGLFTRAALLRRSNLYAGVRVVIAGRFPYLFTNFSTYAKTEQWVMRGKDKARKTLQETLTCIAASTIASSSIITAIECPKIMDQMAGSGKTGKRTTVLDVVRKHGVLRVLRGYDATFCREFLFNWALLGASSSLW
jgi:hypothetical protein